MFDADFRRSPQMPTILSAIICAGGELGDKPSLSVRKMMDCAQRMSLGDRIPIFPEKVALGIFARDSGADALVYVLTGNIVVAPRTRFKRRLERCFTALPENGFA
jgi:hypothetical protein